MRDNRDLIVKGRLAMLAKERHLDIENDGLGSIQGTDNSAEG